MSADWLLFIYTVYLCGSPGVQNTLHQETFTASQRGTVRRFHQVNRKLIQFNSQNQAFLLVSITLNTLKTKNTW